MKSMEITDFKLVKETWWRNFIATFIPVKRITMKIDGSIVEIDWHGYVTFQDEDGKLTLHISQCSQEFLDMICEQLKNNC